MYLNHPVLHVLVEESVMVISEIYSLIFYTVVFSFVVLFSVKKEDNSQGERLIFYTNLVVSLFLYMLFIDVNNYIPFYTPIGLIGQDLVLFLVLNFVLFLYLSYVSVAEYRYIYLGIFTATYILLFFLRISLDVSYNFILIMILIGCLLVLVIHVLKKERQ